MKLIMSLAFLLFSLEVVAQDLNCEDSTNLPQQAMNHCAYLDWQKADKALNIVWPRIKNWAKNTDISTRDFNPEYAIAEESLMKAQRAWINYRDGHCETEGMSFAGGSMQPLIISSCKATLTRRRTEELLLLLEEY